MPVNGSYMLEQDLGHTYVLPISDSGPFDVSAAQSLLYMVQRDGQVGGMQRLDQLAR